MPQLRAANKKNCSSFGGSKGQKKIRGGFTGMRYRKYKPQKRGPTVDNETQDTKQQNTTKNPLHPKMVKKNCCPVAEEESYQIRLKATTKTSATTVFSTQKSTRREGSAT